MEDRYTPFYMEDISTGVNSLCSKIIDDSDWNEL